uniref:Uncharacterized protein n=1 Tax=Fagus sylvatica TaxID=28930 RepID=A0A2N9IXB5_FAGSY
MREGRGVGFIENRARLAWVHYAPRGMVPHELWYRHMAVLSFHASSSSSGIEFFLLDSGQTGDAIGEPRVPRRSWSHYLSNAPGPADQLVFARVFDLVPDVGFRRSWYRRKDYVAYFCKVLDLRKSELGLVRYGPANRGHRSVATGVFLVRLRAVFRSGFRLAPEDSVRKRGNVGGKIPELSAKPYFVGLFFTRVVDIAPDVGFRRSWYRRKACATYFSTVQALHRGELGFARYDLANRGRRSVPYAKGSSSD